MISLILKSAIVGVVVGVIVSFIPVIGAYAVAVGAVAALLVFLQGVGV